MGRKHTKKPTQKKPPPTKSSSTAKSSSSGVSSSSSRFAPSNSSSLQDDDNSVPLSAMNPNILQQLLASMMASYSSAQQQQDDDDDDYDDDDEEYEDDDGDEEYDDDDEEYEEEEDVPGYNRFLQGLLEFQQKEELGLVGKNKSSPSPHNDDSGGEYPISEPMNWDKFFKPDFPTGFYNTIDSQTVASSLQSVPLIVSCDPICDENSFYYTMMVTILSPLGYDVRRFLMVQKYRKQGDNPRANVRPETYSYYEETTFKVCPSVDYLKSIISKKFIPKEKQNSGDDILEDKELVRVAKFVISSKKRRKQDFEYQSNSKWSESLDTNTLDSEDYDTDANDPENKIVFKDDHECERYKEYKTEGAVIRRILIGSWSPCPCYDGQFRIKISPLFRKIYYRFFTFLPSYHNNFKDDEERNKYFSLLTKILASQSAFSEYLRNEFERLKNSSILSMEIDYSSITGIHLQKCSVDKRVFTEELYLLVLQVNEPPLFYSRKIKDVFTDMKKRKRDDFTDNCAASTNSRHYICGSEREMKRIVSILIQSDTTGNLRKLYKEGMKNISPETESVTTTTTTSASQSSATSSSSASSSSSSPPINAVANKMLNNYKLTADKKVLGECIHSHLNENFTHLLWEKLLTTPVTEASNQTGIDLRNRGYSEAELNNLKLYQILGNEKFTKDIYFSFCNGRFYKTSEYHHVNGKCCSVNDEKPTNAALNKTPTTTPTPITTTATTTATTTQQTQKTISNKTKVVGTPFNFVNIGSVIEYPLPPSFPHYFRNHPPQTVQQPQSSQSNRQKQK